VEYLSVQELIWREGGKAAYAPEARKNLVKVVSKYEASSSEYSREIPHPISKETHVKEAVWAMVMSSFIEI